MKKTLMIIGGIFLGMIALGAIIIIITAATSKKMNCESSKGNITIMYSNDTITGYSATNITYDLDQAKKYAEQIGVDAYLDEFSTWFSTNTTGTCSRA